MNLIEQLVEIYHEKEDWHTTKLSKSEAKKYFQKVLDKGLIIYTTDKEGEVVAYCEFWRINFEQLAIAHGENPRNVRNWVHYGSPTLPTVEKLANMLKVPSWSLLHPRFDPRGQEYEEEDEIREKTG